jgi:Family of unknown function (DUF6152)
VKVSVIATMIIGGLSLMPTSQAHHAGTAFDATRELTVVGTVKEFKWVNPHIWLYLMVPNAKGEQEEWRLEGGSISILGRAGWNSKLLQPGEKVTVSVSPLRNGENGGEFKTVTKADGKTYGWGMP